MTSVTCSHRRGTCSMRRSSGAALPVPDLLGPSLGLSLGSLQLRQSAQIYCLAVHLPGRPRGPRPQAPYWQAKGLCARVLRCPGSSRHGGVHGHRKSGMLLEEKECYESNVETRRGSPTTYGFSRVTGTRWQGMTGMKWIQPTLLAQLRRYPSASKSVMETLQGIGSSIIGYR